MENVKVNVAARISILETRTGRKISLDDISYDLTKEQYERLLTSYKTKMYKYMNEDENISDICDLFTEYYGYEDLDDGQKLIVGYPIEVSTGLSFDVLPKITNDEIDLNIPYSGSYSGGSPMFINSSNNRIELSDGIYAYCGEGETYICNVAWLGRDIEVSLYSCEEDFDAQIETIKKAFENFMTNKSDYLKMCQNDILEKLLPYEENDVEADLKISADDFYADYSLSGVYVMTGEGYNEIQLTFSNENDDVICVHRDLDSGNIMEFFDGYREVYPEDMGL